MLLVLAVIGLTSVAVAQQEFIPIGGGSGVARPRIPATDFGEPFTPKVIDPNDPSFQPANLEGNRPNPIPVFPKSQLAGTPHEAPVDFTFTHQHPYKNPFRSDQFVGDRLTIPIGAARPNIPRTLGREMVYIDPRANPNSEFARDETEKKLKNMIFFGLAPPVEKLHRADEFAPSSVPLQNPWDAWYDRFEEAQGLPRRQSPLTVEKRPTITRYPYYAADREKREAEPSTEAPEAEAELTTTTTTTTTTTAAPTTTTIVLSDAIGSTTTITALDATITADAAVIGTTSATVAADPTTTTTTVKPTVAAAPTATTPAPVTISTITSSPAVALNSTVPAAATTALHLNITTTAAPVVASSLSSKVVTVSSGTRLNITRRPTFARKSMVSTPLSKSAPIEFRRRNVTTAVPLAFVQRQRALNHTRVPLRTTLANGVEKPAPTSVSRRPFVQLKLDNAVGTAKNESGTLTTKLPLRTTTFLRRPVARTGASLRKLFNTTTTAAPAMQSATTSSTKAGVTPAVPSSTAATAANTTASAAPTTTPAIAVIGASKAAINRTTLVSARTKAPFRVFSKRPLATSKLPARTPIITDIKKVGSALDTNSIGTLRDEVNRLLTTVVQLQSTVIAQQERIAHLENQLRRRRAAAKGQVVARGDKTTRFIAPNGRTVERTMQDIRKSRAARMRQIVSQANLRQRSNIA